MSELFSNLPDGATHLKGFLDSQDQADLIEACRWLLKTHPLAQPTTKSGYPLSLQISSWGKTGWWGSNGEYLYIEQHPITGAAWPDIPMAIREYVSKALSLCGYYPEMQIDTVLLNWYPAKTGKLGRHQDVTEEDLKSPIVTFSLGDSCIFNIGGEGYKDKGVEVELHSGDAIVMAGESRLAYHGVTKLLPTPNSPLMNGGRISLTARKVFR